MTIETLPWGDPTAADPLVTTFYCKFVSGWPGPRDGARCDRMLLSRALTAAWRSDRYLVGYTAPLERRMRMGALTPDHQAELGAPITMQLLIVEVDHPAKKASTAADIDRWWSEVERPKVLALLADHPGLFAFRSRGGYRVVGRLERAFLLRGHEDAAAWRRLYLATLAMLARVYQIAGDASCADWTRFQGCPRSTREGQQRPENREVIGNARAVGTWDLGAITPADWTAAETAAGPVRPMFVPSAPTGPGYVLREIFGRRGWLGQQQHDGRFFVLCPWRSEHSSDTDGTSSTVIWPPSGGTLGSFRCAHAHCERRTAQDVLRLFTADEIDEANGRPTRAERIAASRPPWPSDQDAPVRRRASR